MKRRIIRVPARSPRDPAFSVSVEYPDSPRLRQVLIFVHGLGYSRRDYSLNADLLPNRNAALVHAVLRGHPQGPESFRLEDSARDLSRIIDAIKEQEDLKDLPLVCLAHSVGAFVAFQAARIDSRIEAICAVSIITSLSASMDYLVESGRVNELYWAHHHTEPEENSQRLYELTSNPDWRSRFREALASPSHPLRFPCRYGLLRISNYEEFARQILYSPDAMDIAADIRCPTVLFHGHRDEMIGPRSPELFQEKLSTPVSQKEVITLHGGGHFLEDYWPQILNKTLQLL